MLTFTTYLRHLTQSLKTLASLGQSLPEAAGADPTRLRAPAERLEAVRAASLPSRQASLRENLRQEPTLDVAENTGERQMRRIERQIAVLERAATL